MIVGKKTFKHADYFEAINFSFQYETAKNVYIYAHGGTLSSMNTIGSKSEWDSIIRYICSIVPKNDRPRIIVKVYNTSHYQGPLSSGGTSGFVFILDRKIIAWNRWMCWIS
jgi:hypothetical protein